MRGRPYCKVSPRLVTGSFGRSVRGEDREALLAQSLGQGYVCNCPHGNAIGLFFLPIGYIMADKGWSEQTTKEALAAIQQRGLIQYNWRTEWCWVIEDFRHEFGPDPDRRPGDLDERGTVKKEDSRIPLIRDLVQEAAGSGLLGPFMAHHQPQYPYLLGWWNAPSDAPSGDADTPRGTPRSRARVRVQEQDQEVEQEYSPPSGDPPAGGAPPAKPLNPQAAKVKRLEEFYREQGAKPPEPGVLAKWMAKLGGVENALLFLDDMHGKGKLGQHSFCWECAKDWQPRKPVQGKATVSVDEMKRRSGYGGRP